MHFIRVTELMGICQTKYFRFHKKTGVGRVRYAVACHVLRAKRFEFLSWGLFFGLLTITIAVTVLLSITILPVFAIAVIIAVFLLLHVEAVDGCT